jgi:hypothetical protein
MWREVQTMLLSKPVTDIIRKRFSVRSYINDPIEENKKKKLREFFLENISGPLGSQARFILVSASLEDREELKGLISYGMIRNVPGFIIGATGYGKKNLEDFGYMMEKNILMATDMELGTCWLGATFNSSGFAMKINRREDEIVPAVCAIGNHREKRTAWEKIVRTTLGSDRRKPWDALFFTEGGALTREEAGSYSLCLDMVRIAPSATNNQPWRILKMKERNIFHFYLQRTLGYKTIAKATDKEDSQRVDIGVAMCHFELTALEAGLSGKWQVEYPGIGLPSGNAEYVVTWIGEK